MRVERKMVAFALVGVVLGILAMPARAESVGPSASFDDRFVVATSSADATPPSRIDMDPRSAEPIKDNGPSGRSLDPHTVYRALLETEAKREGLASEIAEAVMAVESGFNPAAIGGVGEIGLMQILPSTARMMGFSGTTTDLASPETNIHYGVAYLAQAWRLARGDLCTTVMKYRAGHGETRFSYRSVDYCLAVRSRLAARGHPVTGTVPVPTFGETTLASCRHKCTTPRPGRVNLSAINSQLSQLVAAVRAPTPR